MNIERQVPVNKAKAAQKKAAQTKRLAKAEKIAAAKEAAKTADMPKLTARRAKDAAAAELTPKPKAAKYKRSDVVAKRAATEKGESHRVVVGTPTKEWRVRRSQRVGISGWFLQGGITVKTARGESFVVGSEKLFSELEERKPSSPR